MPEQPEVLDWPKYVKSMLKINGWTHWMLAERVGVSESAVSKWKSGAVEPSNVAKKVLLQLGGHG